MNDLTQLIERATAERPRSIALKCEGESVTYAELDELIRRYQTCIKRMARKTGSQVTAILAYKSIEAVAFAQASLREGLAYTVLDPRHPAARIKLILADCKPGLLFTDQSRALLDQVLSHEERSTPAISAEHPLDAGRDVITCAQVQQLDAEASSTPRVDPALVAFIVYTSGSTGIPKGVKISHANALYSVGWAQDALRFGHDEVFLNQAHLGTDFCILDYYNAWNVGASVVMVPEYAAIFPAQVVALIHAERVTNLWLVPSNIISLIKHGTLLDTQPGQLKRLLYAGEPFPVRFLRQVHAWLSGRDIYNLYGPAETNVATFHKVREQDLVSEVPLGKAIPGSELAVRGADGSLQPAGSGELCVCSPSVFAGYTNRQDLNAVRFLSHEGRTWYRTGDIVKLEANGLAWFRGRVDHMVKVRGYRVELQEVELGLLESPDVLEAVVHAELDAEEKHKELHAFCVLRPGTGAADVRSFAAKRLPAYMVPRHVHPVTEIPINDRGKVDRLALASEAARART